MKYVDALRLSVWYDKIKVIIDVEDLSDWFASITEMSNEKIKC